MTSVQRDIGLLLLISTFRRNSTTLNLQLALLRSSDTSLHMQISLLIVFIIITSSIAVLFGVSVDILMHGYDAGMILL